MREYLTAVRSVLAEPTTITRGEQILVWFSILVCIFNILWML